MTISGPGPYQAGNKCKGLRQALGSADPLKKANQTKMSSSSLRLSEARKRAAS